MRKTVHCETTKSSKISLNQLEPEAIIKQDSSFIPSEFVIFLPRILNYSSNLFQPNPIVRLQVLRIKKKEDEKK